MTQYQKDPLETNVQLKQNEVRQQIGNDDTGKNIGLVLFITALVYACFNLAFIIPDLIYAYQGTTCVTTVPQGFSFNLSVWLQVDAYLRIGIVVLLLIAAISACISTDAGAVCTVCVLCVIIFYSIFALAWTIVGSVMFWGKLNSDVVCTGGVRSYMYALLIISYASICCMCFHNLSSNKNRKEQYQ